MKTKQDLMAEINTINIAIGKLISGEQIINLVVGSGEFKREYAFAQITYENLLIERNSLQSDLNTLQGESRICLRESNIPLIIEKFPRI